MSDRVIELSKQAEGLGLPTPSADVYYLDQGILVDVGVDGELTYRILKEKGLVENIDKVVLTHCHYDHSGGVKKLLEYLDIDVYIHEYGFDALTTGDSTKTASNLFGSSFDRFEPDVEISDSMEIGPLDVLHTPGHTEDSVSLHWPEEKILFTGDTVFPNGRPGRTDLPTGSIEKMINSLEKINKLDINSIYTGHGGKGKPSSIEKAVNYLSRSYI